MERRGGELVLHPPRDSEQLPKRRQLALHLPGERVLLPALRQPQLGEPPRRRGKEQDLPEVGQADGQARNQTFDHILDL